MKYDVLIAGKKKLSADLLLFLSNPNTDIKTQFKNSILSSGLQDRLTKLYKKIRTDVPESDFLIDGDENIGLLQWIPGHPEKPLNKEYFRNAGAMVVSQMKRIKGKECIVIFSDSQLSEVSNLEALVEGIEFARYSFDKFKPSKAEPITFRKLILLSHGKSAAAHIRRNVNRKVSVMKSLNYARNLANSPANFLTPKILAKEVLQRFQGKKGFRVEIYDEKKIHKLKMGALLTVAQGSLEPPRFIIIHYDSGHKSAKTIGLVGKGVTFDSGGLSIKPHAGMEEMKYDMAGAAAVIGIMDALERLKPKINIIAAIPAAENLPSGKALKPGDVVRAFNGKSIEIINTDAEGRLLLADALSFLETRHKPDYMIDFATLTGSIVAALGKEAAGLFGNNPAFINLVRAASEIAGEPVWEMPMWESYKQELESNVADLKNVGGREAGSITAAKFLESFVAATPWVHIDIAGTAYGLKNKKYLDKGATGAGILLTLELIQQLH